MSPTCETCRFFEDVPGKKMNDGQNTGICRFNPPRTELIQVVTSPVAIANPNGQVKPQVRHAEQQVWPVVRGKDWCGQFAPVAEESITEGGPC